MLAVLHASTTRHEEWGGPKRYIRILVHDSAEDLRAAAAAYRPFNAEMKKDDYYGCFQGPYLREGYDEVQKRWVSRSDPHWGGIMRLCRQSLEVEAVVHESSHAAIAIYRMDVDHKVYLGEDVGSKEEALCYIIGDLTQSVTESLYAAKIW